MGANEYAITSPLAAPRVRRGSRLAANTFCAHPRALRVGQALIKCGPRVHDGYGRLGMVYFAPGDKKAAADCYRKVVGVTRTHADYYESGVESTFQHVVDKRDPPASTSRTASCSISTAPPLWMRQLSPTSLRISCTSLPYGTSSLCTARSAGHPRPSPYQRLRILACASSPSVPMTSANTRNMPRRPPINAQIRRSTPSPPISTTATTPPYMDAPTLPSGQRVLADR